MSIEKGTWFENRAEIESRLLSNESYLGSENYVTVKISDTAIGNASALRAAYVTAKSKTPNGSAISISNRVAVILPPGQYDMGSDPLVMDTEYVDLIAMYPSYGGDSGEVTEADALDNIGNYKPPSTVLFATSGEHVLEQSATNIQLIGFGIANLHEGAGNIDAALYVSADDNAGSVYRQMYFFAASTSTGGGVKYPTYFNKDLRGYWEDCIANSRAWRIRLSTCDFEPTMYDCRAGSLSFIGDSFGAASTMDCYLSRCKAGDSSFAGCTAFTGPIPADATFVECEGADKCFGQAAEVAGTFIRCRAGDYSFGGNFSATLWPSGPANFSGYAEDCIAGNASFGGSDTAIAGKLTGELLRCTTTGNVKTLYAEGATIRDSRIAASTTNIDAVTITDSNSKILGSTIEVEESGTGIPINAGSALSVIAVNCIFNNGDNDADGLGVNVTNTATTPNNGVY